MMRLLPKSAQKLNETGVLLLPQFIQTPVIASLVNDAERAQDIAYFTNSTHNVYLTPPDDSLPADHVYNRQITSSKDASPQIRYLPPRRFIRFIMIRYFNNLFVMLSVRMRFTLMQILCHLSMSIMLLKAKSLVGILTIRLLPSPYYCKRPKRRSV